MAGYRLESRGARARGSSRVGAQMRITNVTGSRHLHIYAVLYTWNGCTLITHLDTGRRYSPSNVPDRTFHDLDRRGKSCCIQHMDIFALPPSSYVLRFTPHITTLHLMLTGSIVCRGFGCARSMQPVSSCC